MATSSAACGFSLKYMWRFVVLTQDKIKLGLIFWNIRGIIIRIMLILFNGVQAASTAKFKPEGREMELSHYWTSPLGSLLLAMAPTWKWYTMLFYWRRKLREKDKNIQMKIYVNLKGNFLIPSDGPAGIIIKSAGAGCRLNMVLYHFI